VCRFARARPARGPCANPLDIALGDLARRPYLCAIDTIPRDRIVNIVTPLASLSGLRVAVTGGTSGLGLALVHALQSRGARVAFVARDPDRVRRIAIELPGTHGIVGDVARKEDAHRIALQINAALGGLDVLVNNASSLGPVPLALLADTECEDLEAALAANLVGPFRLTKALLGSLAASVRESAGDAGRALVVNISSDAAVTPYPGWGAYGASKAGLRHLSAIWNEELAEHGVHVVSFDPGDMDTPLHALAVPDADPATLKRPADAARELLALIATELGAPHIADIDTHTTKATA
jgi:NAD(P)-dependent dehydrogenase (short-subunit alcohol dehydrogenase family)